MHWLQKAGARRIVLMGHRGQPKEALGSLSLAPLALALNALDPSLNVLFCPFLGQKALSFFQHNPRHTIFLLENLRFDPGEQANDPSFVKNLSALGNFYVNDAFSVSHRPHGSIVGLPLLLPHAAGLLFHREITQLTRLLSHPPRPFVAVVGGSKISTKIPFIKGLLPHIDGLMLGGAMAHPLLKKTFSIGGSFCEKDQGASQDILRICQQRNLPLMLPRDGIAWDSRKKKAFYSRFNPLRPLAPFHHIYDIGPRTIGQWEHVLSHAKTVVWNGPLGLWEKPPFHQGTLCWGQRISHHTHKNNMHSVIGGGDTLQALGANPPLLKSFTYVSCGGGAFLKWIAGTPLPGLQALCAP